MATLLVQWRLSALQISIKSYLEIGNLMPLFLQTVRTSSSSYSRSLFTLTVNVTESYFESRLPGHLWHGRSMPKQEQRHQDPIPFFARVP